MSDKIEIQNLKATVEILTKQLLSVSHGIDIHIKSGWTCNKCWTHTYNPGLGCDCGNK